MPVLAPHWREILGLRCSLLKRQARQSAKKIKYLSQGSTANYCRAKRRTGHWTVSWELLEECFLATGESVDRWGRENKVLFFSQFCWVGRPESCGENVSITSSQASGRKCRIPFYSHYTAGCSLSGWVMFCIEFAQTRISAQGNPVCEICRWQLCWEKLHL